MERDNITVKRDTFINLLNVNEKLEILRKQKINLKIKEYLDNILKDLTIEVLGNPEDNILNLMKKEKLEGWCFETTESSISFFKDNDCIERGVLFLDSYTPIYYHSWISFKYEGKDYVFDPCLNVICEKKYYYYLFKAKIKSRINSKIVKKELLKLISAPKTKYNPEVEYLVDELFKEILKDKYDDYKKDKENEVRISGTGNIEDPFYINGCGYKVETKENEIIKIKVHYYRSL